MDSHFAGLVIRLKAAVWTCHKMNTDYREVVGANTLVKMPSPGFVFGIIRTVILRLGAVGLSGLGIRFFNWFRISRLDWTEFLVCVGV